MVATKTEYPTLAAALVAFQADLPKIQRTERANIGTYGYDYASLDKITPIILPKLSAVGIAYTAPPSMIDGVFGLFAQLVHTSGEAIGGLYPLGNPNGKAQDIGSAITYARRYALLALTGVQPDDQPDDTGEGGQDDDGAAAHAATAKAAASAAVESEAAVKKDGLQSVRDEMSALVNNPATSKVNGDDANEIMEGIAPGKRATQWTLAELKKGRDALKERSEEKKAAS